MSWKFRAFQTFQTLQTCRIVSVRSLRSFLFLVLNPKTRDQKLGTRNYCYFLL